MNTIKSSSLFNADEMNEVMNAIKKEKSLLKVITLEKEKIEYIQKRYKEQSECASISRAISIIVYALSLVDSLDYDLDIIASIFTSFLCDDVKYKPYNNNGEIEKLIAKYYGIPIKIKSENTTLIDVILQQLVRLDKARVISFMCQQLLCTYGEETCINRLMKFLKKGLVMSDKMLKTVLALYCINDYKKTVADINGYDMIISTLLKIIRFMPDHTNINNEYFRMAMMIVTIFYDIPFRDPRIPNTQSTCILTQCFEYVVNQNDQISILKKIMFIASVAPKVAQEKKLKEDIVDIFEKNISDNDSGKAMMICCAAKHVVLKTILNIEKSINQHDIEENQYDIKNIFVQNIQHERKLLLKGFQMDGLVNVGV